MLVWLLVRGIVKQKTRPGLTTGAQPKLEVNMRIMVVSQTICPICADMVVEVEVETGVCPVCYDMLRYEKNYYPNEIKEITQELK